MPPVFDASNETCQEITITIRSILTTFKHGCPINYLMKEYYENCGEQLPFRRFGFKNVTEFLAAMPDVARFGRNKLGDEVIYAVATTKTQHVAALVRRQKSAPVKSSAGQAQLNFAKPKIASQPKGPYNNYNTNNHHQPYRFAQKTNWNGSNDVRKSNFTAPRTNGFHVQTNYSSSSKPAAVKTCSSNYSKAANNFQPPAASSVGISSRAPPIAATSAAPPAATTVISDEKNNNFGSKNETKNSPPSLTAPPQQQNFKVDAAAKNSRPILDVSLPSFDSEPLLSSKNYCGYNLDVNSLQTSSNSRKSRECEQQSKSPQPVGLNPFGFTSLPPSLAKEETKKLVAGCSSNLKEKCDESDDDCWMKFEFPVNYSFYCVGTTKSMSLKNRSSPPPPPPISLLDKLQFSEKKIESPLSTSTTSLGGFSSANKRLLTTKSKFILKSNRATPAADNLDEIPEHLLFKTIVPLSAPVVKKEEKQRIVNAQQFLVAPVRKNVTTTINS